MNNITINFNFSKSAASINYFGSVIEKQISITQINKFKKGNISIELGIDHKEYSHTTKLTEDNIKSLSADFI